MKTLHKIIFIAVAASTILSCKKDDQKIVIPSGALTAVNLVNRSNPVIFNNSSQLLSPNSPSLFFLKAGQFQVNFADTVAAHAQVYFDRILTVNNADNYSLFLAGASPAEIESVLIKETYRNYPDSLCGVRFINLAPGSEPISVNIAGEANGSEVVNLAYKSYSEFKQHPAKKANTDYNFEIRNAATGDLLTTYDLPTPYFKNATIMIYGTPVSAALQLIHP